MATKAVPVTFSPAFASAPSVQMATNRVWLNSNDQWSWGFYSEAKNISPTGFKGYLYAEDIVMSWHWATWIACGKAEV